MSHGGLCNWYDVKVVRIIRLEDCLINTLFRKLTWDVSMRRIRMNPFGAQINHAASSLLTEALRVSCIIHVTDTQAITRESASWLTHPYFFAAHLVTPDLKRWLDAIQLHQGKNLIGLQIGRGL